MSAESFKEEGNKAYVAKDFAKAEELYSRAIDLDGKNHVYFSNRSAARLALGKGHLALEDAMRCTELAPDFVKGFGRLGQAYLAVHRPGHAERAFRKGLMIDRGNDACSQGLESILKRDGDQSSKRSLDGSDRAIRQVQGDTGMAMHPSMWGMEEFPTAVFVGDLAKAKAAYNPALHADLRVTPSRIGPLTLCLSGAQRMVSGPTQPQHLELIEWLLEQGARPDARDIAGQTALFHSLMHHERLDIAEALLRAGADINIQ